MTQTLSKNVIADFSTQLAVKMAVGATTGTLASATDSDSVALPTGVYFLTLDKNNSKKEYIKCTLTGTALTNIQSISRQGALTTGCAREHRVGANVIISDFASLNKINDVLTGVTNFDSATPLGYDGTASITTDNQFTTKKYVDDSTVGISGDETIAGVKTFSSSPIVPTPTTDFQTATKKYADDLAIAGSPDASTTVKGIVEKATTAEIVAGTSTGSTGAELFVGADAVATNGANKVLRTDANGLSLAQSLPEIFSTQSCGSYRSFGTTYYNYTDLSLGFMVMARNGAIFRMNCPTYGVQTRTIASDWASAVDTRSAIHIGSYIYLLLLDDAVAYRVYRYDASNIAAGGTLMTFSGQSLTYNNDEQKMFTDGTNFYFTCKAGASANDYVISKYTLSGTTFTYVSDITCGAVANTMEYPVKADASGNLYGWSTTDNLIRKYNSSGTLQSTTLSSIDGQSQTFYNMGSYATYMQSGFQDVYATMVHLLHKIYII